MGAYRAAIRRHQVLTRPRMTIGRGKLALGRNEKRVSFGCRFKPKHDEEPGGWGATVGPDVLDN